MKPRSTNELIEAASRRGDAGLVDEASLTDAELESFFAGTLRGGRADSRSSMVNTVRRLLAERDELQRHARFLADYLLGGSSVCPHDCGMPVCEAIRAALKVK